MGQVLICLIAILVFVSVSLGDYCTHPVYCTGPLLNAVQMARVYNDSKTFVDMPMRLPPNEVLELFNELFPNTSHPNKNELKRFVEKYFYPVGSDLEAVIPTDWVSKPGFLHHINSSIIRGFASSIHGKWRNLVRQWNNSFCDGCYSHIDVDEPFVIAGNRFREFYYWDTYWTVQGLLVGGMTNTTKGVLLNLLQVIQEIGFLPNGGRVYYLNRSQPPFLTQMVYLYMEATNDLEFLGKALPVLDMEYEYWMSNTSIEVEPGYFLNRYNAMTKSPRPESYYEDVVLGETVPASYVETLYQQIATGAETGWDFSSRWMDAEPNLATLVTNTIIPVDLNSILYKNEIVMAQLYELVNRSDMNTYYTIRAEKRANSIAKFLWNEDTGVWNDRFINGTFNPLYYGYIFYPFWAGLHTDLTSEEISRIIQNLTSVLSFPGGVPASMLDTGQQWDFPNGWAPIQYMTISGLNAIAGTEGLTQELRTQCAELALNITSNWLTSNYCAWNVTGMMFEKYDVTTRGIPGGGGEYEVQRGFGWTNGVALHLLQLYANDFTLGSCGQDSMYL